MLTRSASKQENETCQGDEGEILIIAEHIKSNKKSTDEMAVREDINLEAQTTEELSLSSLTEADALSESQNEVHSDASESTIVLNQEENQSQQFHSPIFNIHIHVSPSNSDSFSTPATVQPIIHLHFDENNKSHGTEKVSSQNSLDERRVQNFLSVRSTESNNLSVDLNDSSDIVNNTKENNNTSPIHIGNSEKNGTDIDMSDLSNISSEISTEWLMKKVIQKQAPVIKVVNVKKRKRHKYSIKKKDKSDQDKDFESVFPKLQNKLKNIINEKLGQDNTCSYNKVKEKEPAEFDTLKHLMENDENSRSSPQLDSVTSNESKELEDPDVICIEEAKEVIVISDSDSLTEMSNHEETFKDKKMEESNNNIERTKEDEDVESSEDERRKDSARKYKSVKRSVNVKKQERVRTREIRDRKCKNKKPNKEHLNWVKKVAFAKACQLQPNVFTEKEILVKSADKPKKPRKYKRKSKTSDERKEKQQVSNSCKTPKRLSSFHYVNKHWSREISDVHSSLPNKKNKRRTNKVEVSDSENERDEEISKSKKSEDLERRWKILLASVNGNEQKTQESDSLVSCETPKGLSYGCESQPTLLAEKKVVEKSPVDSKKAQELKNESETSLISVNSHEETQQDDSLFSWETPEGLSYDCELQQTSFRVREVLEKSPTSPKSGQELKSIWQNAFVSVNKKKETQQNDSLVSCETVKWISSHQQADKHFSKELSDVESSPKALGSPNKKQESKDQISVSENETNEEICTLRFGATTPIREENLESSNNSNKRCMTLLAEGCTFSEILQKFREKHYKDKVKVFFPNRSYDNHIPQESSCGAKESRLEEDELQKTSGNDSNVPTGIQKKEKEEDDELKTENKADENSNPSLSLEEPVKSLPSPTDKPLQSTHPPVSTQVIKSVNETRATAIRVSVISHSNRFHVRNENSLSCVGTNVIKQENFEEISDGINVKESCYNSALTGYGTTPENRVILREGNHETNDYVNEFRAIKKKLRPLADNNLFTPDLEKKNGIQSSNGQLDTHGKGFLNTCMAQYSDDIKEPEETDFKPVIKRKGSPDSLITEKSPSSPKKMKQIETNGSLNQGKASNKKAFTGDDYIPLEASGPTKFAVAPLDKVTPYREHSAKDFKGNMLYGDRVKRFNSSNTLDIYKLKQKAGRESFY